MAPHRAITSLRSAGAGDCYLRWIWIPVGAPRLPQGSILGPLLWNYHVAPLLHQLSQIAYPLAFADDIQI
eukprot:2972338-Amphidinium_carterae.1